MRNRIVWCGDVLDFWLLKLPFLSQESQYGPVPNRKLKKKNFWRVFQFCLWIKELNNIYSPCLSMLRKSSVGYILSDYISGQLRNRYVVVAIFESPKSRITVFWFVSISMFSRNNILREKYHHHHHVTLLGQIFLTLSCHPSQSSIAPGRSSRLHPI